jgi:hypothetical protein
VRTTDIAALSGLQVATTKSILNDDAYVSTDDREMMAYRASVAANMELGEVEFDEEDLINLRSGL